MTRITPALACLALAVAAVPVFASTTVASSQAADDSAITWTVAPADATSTDGRSAIETVVDPGDGASEHMAVTNLSGTEVTFALSAADGYYTQTGRFTMLDASRESVDAGTWIELPTSVTVPAGETAIVPFSIAVPDNATPGDHAAGVAASVLSSGAGDDGAQVGLESRVGFRVLTRVTGELAPAIEVTETRSDHTTSWTPWRPGTLTVSYTVTNTGNVALAIEDSLSGAAAGRGDLLPGERRDIAIEPVEAWPTVRLASDLTVTGTPSLEGADPVQQVEPVTAWAMPWPQLLVVAGLALIAMALLTGRRSGQRRLDRRLDEAREQGRQEARGQGADR